MVGTKPSILTIEEMKELNTSLLLAYRKKLGIHRKYIEDKTKADYNKLLQQIVSVLNSRGYFDEKGTIIFKPEKVVKVKVKEKTETKTKIKRRELKDERRDGSKDGKTESTHLS